MACPGHDPRGEYAAENLRVLGVLERIRLHAGMYIGSTDSRGLSHILFSLVTNSLAEAAAGAGRVVRVALRADGSVEVGDDGRVPADDAAAELAFGRLGTGSQVGYCSFNGREYAHYAVAHALSERLSVTVRWPGSRYQHVFRRGMTDAAVLGGGPPDDRGLTVALWPDPLIFGEARFDAAGIRARLQQLAFLHSGVRLTFSDEVTGTRDEFEYADGVREYVQSLCENREALHDPILLRGEEQGVRYEVGLRWCADGDEVVRSFANHDFTSQGGTHYHGLIAGAVRGLSDFISEDALNSGEFARDDFREGLVAVVSVWLRTPFFISATASQLGNPEVEAVVSNAVRTGVRAYFEANRDSADRVVRAVVLTRDIRVASRKARKSVRQNRNGG
jgi:DNA gyrase/topoisomerase IV subunit B